MCVTVIKLLNFILIHIFSNNNYKNKRKNKTEKKETVKYIKNRGILIENLLISCGEVKKKKEKNS